MATTPGKHQSLLGQAAELHKAGRLKKAEQLYRQLLKREPRNVAALHLLAMIRRDQNAPKKAVELLRKAVKIDPDRADVQADLGLALSATGRVDEAIAAFGRAAELEPSRAELHFHLGRLYVARSTMTEAIPALSRAVELAPDRIEYHDMLVGAINSSGFSSIDTSYAERLVELDPTRAASVCHLATAHRLNGSLDEADVLYRRALELDPDLAAAIAGRAHLLESRDQSEAAYELLQESIRRDNLTTLVATAHDRICKRLGRRADSIPVLRRVLDRRDITPYHRASLGYSLGQALEATGEYEPAFQQYRQANRLNAGRWDRVAHRKRIDATIAAFSPELFETLRVRGSDSQVPIFIVGMFRSGTTLVETILSSHPQVHGAGEIDNLPRIAESLEHVVGVSQPFPAYVPSLDQAVVAAAAERYLREVTAAAPEAARITDKMLLNYLLLGFIQLLFPSARVIHCLRHPLDTCLSCYTHAFTASHGYSCDLGDLGATYREYRRLMDHWRAVLRIPIMEIRYEQLVREQEPTTRSLVDFCGLEWNDACLRFHESGRVARTLSIDQVRQRMYTSSIGRYRRFEAHLGKLKDALGDLPEAEPDVG